MSSTGVFGLPSSLKYETKNGWFEAAIFLGLKQLNLWELSSQISLLVSQYIAFLVNTHLGLVVKVWRCNYSRLLQSDAYSSAGPVLGWGDRCGCTGPHSERAPYLRKRGYYNCYKQVVQGPPVAHVKGDPPLITILHRAPNMLKPGLLVGHLALSGGK